MVGDHDAGLIGKAFHRPAVVEVRNARPPEPVMHEPIGDDGHALETLRPGCFVTPPDKAEEGEDDPAK